MSSMNVASLFGVKGLVAVITGGGSGIGLMMTKALEENGAKVYIIGRRLEVLESAAKQAQHGNIIPLQGDVTSKDDLNKIVAQITREEGFINVLIANSGITGPTLEKLPQNPTIAQIHEYLWDTDPQYFNKAFKVNTIGVFFSVVAFLPLLEAGNAKGNIEQKSQVIATASIAAFNRIPLAGFAYGSSKSGTVHMMKQFATLLTPHNIRSNVIAPGLYPSDMANDAIAFLKDQGGGELPVNAVPMRRPGAEEDMAGTILFLTSRAGAYLSGTVVVTDGGRLGGLPSTY